MNKRFNKKGIFCIIVVLICVSLALPVFAAEDKPIPGKPSGLVMTTNWMADEVGQMILDNGGNAIDAAAAVGYALAVVHPTAGNLGGGGFAVIHLANGENYALDFREMAPASADRLMYVDTDNVSFDINDTTTYRARNYIHPETGQSVGAASLNGYIAAGVPGTVAGLNEMVAKYGTKTLAEIMEPAIRLAGNGFKLTAGTADSLNSNRTSFNRYMGSRRYFVKPDGSNFQENELFVQTDLAKTLKRIAQNGSDGFYKGVTADLIVADMPKYGGIITHADLANYVPVWRTPAQGTYRNFKVFSMCPPSSGGTHIVQILNTIENENIGTLGFNSLRTIWLMTEAMRYAYADRSEYMGDPDYVNVPVDALTSKDYGKEIYDKIIAHGELKAKPSIEIKPGLGPLNEGNETTHYSVVDSFGNAVGITYTINMGYGCKVAVDGGGFFMNNEMDDFMTVPGQPNGFGLIQGEANCVEPGKRPLSSMSPTIVLRSADNSVFLVTGSPGGSQIITTVLHTVVNAIDHGMNVTALTAAPRFHMQWMPDTLTYERMFGFTNDTTEALRDMGYNLAAGNIGDVAAIMVGAATGSGRAITGAHDPRTYYPAATVQLDLDDPMNNPIP